MKKILSLSLALVLLASVLVACQTPKVNGNTTGQEDVLAKVSGKKVDTKDKLTDENSTVVTDFSSNLLRHTYKDGENTLVSPVSVLYAMGMVANGADSDTLAQMEKTFGLKIDDLNGYLNAYLKSLPTSEDYKFNIANSIWLKDGVGFEPKEDFLQKNKDYYDAKIYKAKFDMETVKDINAWVKENTAGMIDSVIDKIPEDSVMYLINALALQAKWANPYQEGQVLEGDFTKANGEVEKVDFMYKKENSYLEGETEKGFKKDYVDGKYSFVALLPNEGIKMEDFLKSLTGEKIHGLLKNAKNEKVETSLPKFEHEYSTSLNDALKQMGVKKAFSKGESDFSKMGENLFISNVIHKTYISVHEKGTEAGAVTAVEMGVTSADPNQPKEVYLNRPFVYMIVDNQNHVPIFLGTYMGK